MIVIYSLLLLLGCIDQQIENNTEKQEIDLVEFLRMAEYKKLPIECNSTKLLYIDNEKFILDDKLVHFYDINKSYIYDSNRECWVEILINTLYHYRRLPDYVSYCKIVDYKNITLDQICYN